MISLAAFSDAGARTHADRLREYADGAEARGDHDGAAALRAEADRLDAR